MIRPLLDKLSDSEIFVSDELLERILVLAGESS
jgi:predicted nucleic acid-binding protein